MPSRSRYWPTAITYIEFAPSMWNMYGLQLAPRSASELQPVLMNTVLSRLAPWAMASPAAPATGIAAGGRETGLKPIADLADGEPGGRRNLADDHRDLVALNQ